MPLFVDPRTGVEYIPIPRRFVTDRRVRGSAGLLYIGLCRLCTKAGVVTGTFAELAEDLPPRCRRSIRKGMQTLRELGYVVLVKRRRSQSTYFLPDMVIEGEINLQPTVCSGCERAVPAFERWCSDWCRELHRLRTEPAVRRRWVYRRDGGVCAICRVDTDAIESQLRELTEAARAGDQVARNQRAILLRHLVALGFNARLASGSFDRPCWGPLWEADHILPVVEGGGDCDLSNLRTLCVPCHKGATAELRARLPRRLEGRLT